MKGWVKIPIPKQIFDDEHDRKQTKYKENNKITINVLGHCLGMLKKIGKGQVAIKQIKGIVLYTASIQQIGSTFWGTC